MRQRGIIGIFVLILILVLAVAGGAYYLGRRITTKPQVTGTNQVIPTTPLPSKASVTEGDPTANWKVYTNSKFRYMFKYSPNVEVYNRVEILPDNEKERDIATTCCVGIMKNSKAVLGIEAFQDGKFLEEYKRDLSKDSAVSRMEEITFAGERALTYMYTSVKTLTVVHEGTSYHFLFVEGAEELANQTLSTFKFD